MTSGLLDFFTLEASEYVEELDALASRAVDYPPDPDDFARVLRGLRGSATMAKQSGIAEVASGLERLARNLRDETQQWDHAVRGVAIGVIDDLKILIRNVRTWGAEEESRAGARISELERIAPRVVATRPRGRGSEFLATTAADAATGLLEYAESPGSPQSLAEIMKRVRVLRGVAALKDLPPLAEVVDVIDAAAKPIEIGQDTATAERRRLFRCAARVLMEGGDAVRRGGVPPIDSAAVREFAHAAETLRSNETDTFEVVPIASLFPDDSAADAVRPAPNPPTTAAERFRLEVVSQAEHLHRIVEDARGALDPATRDRLSRELRSSVRSLAQSAQSFTAIEIANVFLAAERGAAALEPRSLEVLGEAARLLSDPSTPPESVAPRFISLAQILAGTPAAGIIAVRPSAALPRRREGTPISGPINLPRRSRQTPIPTRATPVTPAGTPGQFGSTPTDSPAQAGEPPSGATLQSLLASGIAGLEPLGSDHLAQPVLSGDDDIVPIDELLFRGREALDRAMALSAQLRSSTAPPDHDLLEELYDLLQLASAE